MSNPNPALAILAKARTGAWNSKVPETVASFFVEGAWFVINRGEPWVGRARIAEMTVGFHADVPDPKLLSDDVRGSASHVINVRTFAGHHAETGNPVEVRGWEEWGPDDDLKITGPRSWFDADGYRGQIAGG